MTDAQYTQLIRRIADTQAKRHYKSDRSTTNTFLKMLYIAIYQECSIALLDAGMQEETLWNIEGLGDEVVSAMLRNGFHVPNMFDKSF